MDRIRKKDFLKFEKPSRYFGDEFNSVHKNHNEKVKVVFIYPDLYEIGMSSHGVRILYHLLNTKDDIVTERCFTPAKDFEEYLRKNEIPLFTLESHTPLKDFDILAFSIQTELTYTNVLNILELAKIPLERKNRKEKFPLIIAGGSSTYNPEPLSEFFDLFVIGEGEEVLFEIVDTFKKNKNKENFLKEALNISGVYVPEFYEFEYNEDRTIKNLTFPSFVPPVIKKRIIKDFENSYQPLKPIVPFIQTVHDKGIAEIFRGCTRGCRFCQAGMVYRPVREKSPEKIRTELECLLKNTGYEEISLLSLSSSDYSKIKELAIISKDLREKRKVSISLPSLRMEYFPPFLAEEVKKMREKSLTFAIEAGSQRLRNVINKNITEESIFRTLTTVFDFGWHLVKFYFMIGLPTETYEDLEAIVDLTKRIYRFGRERRRDIEIHLSINPFVPKSHTPFQWAKQDSVETLKEKQNFLKGEIKAIKGRIKVSFQDPNMSFLEGVLGRGDRKLSVVIKKAFECGAKFDAWQEFFDIEKWKKAFYDLNISPEFYVYRERDLDEILPWDHINCGMLKEFLKIEYKNGIEEKTTIDCREEICNNCGIIQNFGSCSILENNIKLKKTSL